MNINHNVKIKNLHSYDIFSVPPSCSLLGFRWKMQHTCKYKTWRKVDVSLTEKYNLLFNTNHKLNMIIDIWKKTQIKTEYYRYCDANNYFIF